MKSLDVGQKGIMFWMDFPLYLRVRDHAIERGISVTEYIRIAIKEKVAAESVRDFGGKK